MIIYILYNYNHKYFNLIKYVIFNIIFHVINLNIISSSKIFNKFYFIFLLMNESTKLFLLKKIWGLSNRCDRLSTRTHIRLQLFN